MGLTFAPATQEQFTYRLGEACFPAHIGYNAGDGGIMKRWMR